MPRGVDVGGKGLQNLVGIGQKAHVVAAGNGMAAAGAYQMGKLGKAFFRRLGGLRRHKAVGKGIVKG